MNEAAKDEALMNICTVSFFGHRRMEKPALAEARLEKLIRELMLSREYLVFLVGRSGLFDQLVSSVIRRCKQTLRADHSSLTLVLPCITAEYSRNEAAFHAYYDEIEIFSPPGPLHFKAAYQARNRSMIDRSDLAIFFVDHPSGGAYQTMRYAKAAGVRFINLCGENDPG